MRLSCIFKAQLLAGLVSARFAATPVSELRRVGRTTEITKLSNRQAQYPEYTLSVPVDHFHNESRYEPHSDDTFKLRYWFDASHYKPGGPVVVLGAGETSGEGRLPFLEKGIVYQLSKATGGIGVILEHRYYGTSIPVSDFTTENLRFLTHDQALADTAFFATNVRFEGVSADVTAPSTPWIAYGGSYAGAFVSFLRVRYPDIFWGAISSSGVTEAIYDYWQYFEPVRIYGPQECIHTTQNLTNVIDNILLKPENKDLISTLKGAFGLPNVTYDDDFANVLTNGIYGWQSRNWDPKISGTGFDKYCRTITSDKLLYSATETLRNTSEKLIMASGWGDYAAILTTRMLNYIGYVNATSVVQCTRSGATQDQCFTTRDPTFYKQTDLEQTWRLWQYQVCDSWGYLQNGAGVPKEILPLISRTIDIEYTSIACREAFSITRESNVTDVNKYGGFDIEFDRLAFVDGETDPWREATPHAFGARSRTSTTNKPFILIEGAVHHWDENGVFPNETTPDLPPKPVADAQKAEAEVVIAWLQGL